MKIKTEVDLNFLKDKVYPLRSKILKLESDDGKNVQIQIGDSEQYYVNADELIRAINNCKNI